MRLLLTLISLLVVGTALTQENKWFSDFLNNADFSKFNESTHATIQFNSTIDTNQIARRYGSKFNCDVYQVEGTITSCYKQLQKLDYNESSLTPKRKHKRIIAKKDIPITFTSDSTNWKLSMASPMSVKDLNFVFFQAAWEDNTTFIYHYYTWAIVYDKNWNFLRIASSVSYN